VVDYYAADKIDLEGKMRLTGLVLLALTLILITSQGQQATLGDTTAAADPPAAKAFSFTDVTSSVGIAGDPLAGGHGVAFQDVNGDGYLDIYISNTPVPIVPTNNFLFINNQGESFTEEAVQRGVNGMASAPHGIAFADFDNDGDFDLLVAFAGHGEEEPGQSRLYINDGNGFFSDGTERARLLGRHGDSRGVTVADFDRDGRVDFFITGMYEISVVAPESPIQVKNLFRNRGQGRFHPRFPGILFTGFSQSISAGDLNGDGYPDLVESKWPAWSYGQLSNSLWINDGDGTFTDCSELIGDDFERDGGTPYNATILGDTDNDGDLDMILLADTKLRFYRNDGNLTFTDITEDSGLIGGSFSAALGDLDNDGDLDLVVPHSHGYYSVFENVGGNHFVNHADSGVIPPYFNDPRGCALGDYDNDGDLDLAIVHKYNRIELFRNDIKSRTWLKLLLVSPSGEIGAVGAKVRVYKAGYLGKKRYFLAYREAVASAGYLDQNTAVVHLGFTNPKQHVDIEIEYVDGSKYSLTNVRQRQFILFDPSKPTDYKTGKKKPAGPASLPFTVVRPSIPATTIQWNER
jgi:hypothetical protein